MESAFEDVVHDWRAADPKLLAGGWQDASNPLLVPPRAFLARKSHNQVEVFRVKLLEKAEKSETDALFFVEVGNVVSELEIIADLGSFFLIHLAHHETSDVGCSVHESNRASSCSECKMSAVSLDSERLTHGTFDHIGCVVLVG